MYFYVCMRVRCLFYKLCELFDVSPVGEGLGGGLVEKKELNDFQDQKEGGPNHQRTLHCLAVRSWCR